MAFIRNTLIGAAGAAAIFYHSSTYSEANSGKALFYKVSPMIERVYGGKDVEPKRVEAFTNLKLGLKTAKDGFGRCQAAMDVYDGVKSEKATGSVDLSKDPTTTLKVLSTWGEADELESRHEKPKQPKASRETCGFKSYISTASDGSTNYGALIIFGGSILAVGWALFTYVRDIASKIREWGGSRSEKTKRRKRDPSDPMIRMNLLDGAGDSNATRPTSPRRSVEVGAEPDARTAQPQRDEGAEPGGEVAGMADRDRRDPHSRGSAPTGYDPTKLTTHEDGS